MFALNGSCPHRLVLLNIMAAVAVAVATAVFVTENGFIYYVLFAGIINEHFT